MPPIAVERAWRTVGHVGRQAAREESNAGQGEQTATTGSPSSVVPISYAPDGIPRFHAAAGHAALAPDTTAERLRTFRRPWTYAGALAVSLAALVTSVALGPLIERTPFVVFYVAVALSALWWGLGPALLATAIGVVGITYFCLRPIHSLSIERPADIASLAAFGI